jgi:hypothetical protein
MVPRDRLDTAIETFIHLFKGVQRPIQLGPVDDPHEALDLPGRRVVKIDQGRIRTKVIESATYRVGRPAFLFGG